MEYYERTNRKNKVIKPSRNIAVNEVDIFDEHKISNEFNAFFTNIESRLASKFLNASTTFESYINKPDFIMETKQL